MSETMPTVVVDGGLRVRQPPFSFLPVCFIPKTSCPESDCLLIYSNSCLAAAVRRGHLPLAPQELGGFTWPGIELGHLPTAKYSFFEVSSRNWTVKLQLKPRWRLPARDSTMMLQILFHSFG